MMMYGIFIIPLIDLFIGLFLYWASENYEKFNKDDVSNEILKVWDPNTYKSVSRIHGTNMMILFVALVMINVIVILFLRTRGVITGFPGGIGAIVILIQIVFSSLVSSISKYISEKKYGDKK